MLFKAKPQLLLKQSRDRPYKYPLLIAVAKAAVIDTIIDISTFINNIVNITNIVIYLQDNNTTNIADTTIYL